MSYRKQVRCFVIGIALLVVSGYLQKSARSEDLSGTLRKVKEAGSIVIGHREASIPFSYLDENKRPVGYSVDLCLKIVDEVRAALQRSKIAVRYVAVNPQNRIRMVVDGHVDLECGSTTNTLARQQQVDFSAVFFTTGTRLLTWKRDGIKEIENLVGRTIAVVGGSTNEKAVRALVDNGIVERAAVLSVKDYAEGLATLETRRSDAFATDDIVLFGLLSKSPKHSELEVTGRFLTYDPYGIMFRRDDPEFRLVVTKALAGVFRSGDAARLYAKWFDPMSVPLSPLLKAGFALQAIPE